MFCSVIYFKLIHLRLLTKTNDWNRKRKSNERKKCPREL